MLKNKFFEVLKTFSEDDYIKFKDFVSSDYFNKSETLRNLYLIILKYVVRTPRTEITREFLFKELYPGKKYNESRIVYLLSGLFKLSEDYLVQESYKKDPMSKERYLLKELGARKLNKFFLKCYEEVQSELNKIKFHSEDYFYNRYEADVELITYTTAETINSKTEMIQGWHDKLIDFILVKILIAYIFMFNQKKYGYEHKFKMPFINHLIKYLDENSSIHTPVISIHFNLMMLLKDDDEHYYFKLKDLLSGYPETLDRNDNWTTYICMVNFCETKAELGWRNNKFFKEVNEMYKTIIENEIYKLKGWYPHMHHRLFLNVVLNGLHQKEYEWVESFMLKHIDELSDEHKLSTYYLCFALLNFNKKEYEKSLESLSKVQSENLSYFLHIKSLTLQNYYELNLYDSAVSAIDAYKHFLKENSDILLRDRIHHTNFSNIVFRLLKYKLGEDIYDIDKMDISKIRNTGILEREWLLEKIEEIKKLKNDFPQAKNTATD